MAGSFLPPIPSSESPLGYRFPCYEKKYKRVNVCKSVHSLSTRHSVKVRSVNEHTRSKAGHTVDALALGGDEGRNKLRKSLTRRYTL